MSINFKSNFVTGSASTAANLFPRGLVNSGMRHREAGFFRQFSGRKFRVYCELTTTDIHIRKCAPFLESVLLSGSDVLPSTEWRAVPDIWRTSAENFGDSVALVDPYHDPPTKLTYKQLQQEIVNFSKGLRAVGIESDEKVALFADNSCRWLVADQGTMATGAINVVRGSRSSVEELLHIYNHSDSVALIVDNVDMYNRIVQSFGYQASVRFVILLWGEKSSLAKEAKERFPVYCYKEILDLGHEWHTALHSEDSSE